MTGPPAAPALRRIRRAVLGVGRGGLRPFPWRETRDPWAVLVSEVMLQQTQAQRVVSAYLDFLDRFPTASACARAGLGPVLEAWAGLGYNRRARHLHQAALAIVDLHGGTVPADLPSAARFPAWGSTRRAPSWSSPSSVTRRSSTSTWRGCCNGRCPARRSLRRAAQTLADSLVPAGRAWAWNQALMELGAATCSSRAPACGRCPLSPSCAWRNSAPGAPDPAARGPRQSRFEGSDRQGRGRLVDALRSGPVPPGRLRVACGWPEDPDRARRVADDLVAEGLARRGPGDVLVLP